MSQAVPPHAEIANSFGADGFLLSPQLVPDTVIERAGAGMDAVIAGDYETGVAPMWRGWDPGGDPAALVKIDAAHWADGRIADLVRSPAVGRWAAAITGARRVQVWATQLLHKPPAPARGNVGWHQDDNYWRDWWAGDVFTCWVAISDVRRESGPVRFVRGSHRWGPVDGDFFSQDLKETRDGIVIPEGADWEETEAILPAGAVSFHHRFTVHGSGPNVSANARRAIAIHLRTEQTEVLDPTSPYLSDLDDLERCPVIFDDT